MPTQCMAGSPDRTRGTCAGLAAAPCALWCPACRGTQVVTPYPRVWEWLRVCKDCGLGWSHPRPASSELALIYGPRYFEVFGYTSESAHSSRQTRRVWFDRLLSTMERHVAMGRLLDVGSGLGDLMVAGLRRGWVVRGIDANPRAVSEADAVVPGATRLANIDEGLPDDEAFDLVVCADVLEHLQDPWASMSAMHQALRPGGAVAVTTIDRDSLPARLMGPRWFHIHRDHLWYFNRAVLAEAAHAAGFEVVACGPASKTFDLNYVLRVLLGVRNSETIARLAELGVRCLPAPVLSRPFRVREGLLLIGRRPG